MSSQPYVDFDDYVDFHLNKTRQNIKSTEVFTTLGWLATLVVGYLLVFVLADHWLIDGGFGLLPRVLMWVVVLSTAAGVLVWKVILPWSQQISELYAAKAIESADPSLKSNLLNYVDLQHAGKKGSPAVAKAMEKRAAVGLQSVDVEQAVDRRPLLRSAYVLLGVVVVACLYTVLSPKDVLTSMKRALLPFSSTHVATQTIISDVTPGDDRVPARTLLTVEADIRGKVPDDVRILYTTADRQDVDQPVEMRRIDEALPRFRGTIAGENGRGVLQNLTYRIVAGDARSPEFTINVVQPPSVKVESVAYKHPDYMRLENKTVASGHIDGWEGTEITLTATANLPLKSAKIVFSDDEKRPAQPETESLTITGGTQLTAKWKLGFRADGTFPRFYRIDCTTSDGQSDPEPTLFTIKIRPDQPPEIALLSPTGDITMPANGTVPLLFQASDPDFLLRWVRLYAEKDGQSLLVPPEHLMDDAEPHQSFRGGYDFALEPLKLKSGDVVQYWIEATDNRQPSANSKRTPKQNIRIVEPVSPQEAKQQLAKEKEKQQDQLASADDARNPDRQPPNPRDDENQPPRNSNDKPQPKQPADEPQNDQPGEKQKPQDGDNEKPNDADKQANDDGSKAGQKNDRGGKDGSQKKKADEDTALEKLINKLKERNEDAEQDGQKGNEQQQPGEKQHGSKPDGKQQKSNDQKSGAGQGEKGQGEKGNSEGAKDGQNQQPGENDSQAEKQQGEKKNTGGTKSGDKPQPGEKPGDDQRDPGTSKKESGADKPGEDSSKEKNDGSKSPNAGQQKSPDDKSPGGQKNDGQKGGAKGADQKSSANEKSDSTGGEKSPGAKPNGEKQTGDKSDGSKDAGQPMKSDSNPGGEKPAPNSENKKADGSRKPDDKSGGQPGEKTAGEKGEKPDGEKQPGSGKPSNEKPTDDKQATTKQDSGKQDQSKQEPGKQEAGKPSDRNAERKNGEPGDQTADQRPSADPKVKPDDRSEKPSAKAPDDKNDDLKGQGKKNQKSPSPTDGGEQGAGKKSDEGAKGDDKTGAGDKSEQKGDKDAASKKNGGQSGSEKGPGSKTKPSDDGNQTGEQGDKSSTKPGKSDKSLLSKSEPGEGEPNSSDGPSKKPQSDPGQPPENGQPGKADGQSKPSDGPIKKSPGKPSDQNAQPGKPGQAPNSKVGGGTDGSQPGNQKANGEKPDGDAGSKSDQPEDPQAAEQANLDYAKKATNLVLKRLKEQLERGDVDQQLLDELGWTKEDAAKFAKWLEEKLNAPRDTSSPEAEARQRQFEELLKSLMVNPNTSRREGDRNRQRRTQQTETRRVTLPPEYREQVEAYTKGLSKTSQPKDAKK